MTRREDAAPPLKRRHLTVTSTPTAELTDADWRELLAFFQSDYEIDLAGLQRSVRSREQLYRVYERATRRLVGTTSVGVMTSRLSDGREARVFFAGDSLLLPSLRGTGIVQELAARTLVHDWIHHPRAARFGAGVALTHFMYVATARSFRDMWPRRDAALPAMYTALGEEVGRRMYADAWRGFDEVVAVHRRGIGEAMEITPAMREDPDIRFFVERNPTYAEGTALPMLMRVDAPNLLGLLWRMVRKSFEPKRRRAKGAPEAPSGAPVAVLRVDEGRP